MPRLKDEMNIKPVLLEVAELVQSKSEDYCGGPTRDDYFPFEQISYTQMIHTKSQRLLSLTMNQLAGEEPNFEGIRDTLKDIIAYAAFNISALDREEI